MLDPSSLLPCTYFRLRWICLLYFVAHTSCYVGYVFCASLHILQGTLDMSSLLRCTYFTLRWIRLLCFLAHTSCYVGYVFFASLHILHVTLDTSSLLPCTYFMLRWTIDSCWKACQKMLPSSLSSQSPMIMTCVKAWQWRFASLPKRWASWDEGKRSAGAVAKHKHDDCKHVAILHRNSSGIYEKCVFYCSGS